MAKSKKISKSAKNAKTAINLKNTKNIVENFQRKTLKINDLKPLLTSKNTKNIIYVMLATILFNIAYLGGILFYLVKLRDCQCYQTRNKINYSNLTYLIVIESILMAFSIITLMGLLATMSAVNSLKSGGGKGTLHPSLYVGFTIYILINGYFVYYVYKLYENVDIDRKGTKEYCECSNSWLRYLLYIQSLLILFSIMANSYNMISYHF